MSEIILYRIKKDLFILQEYLNNYFSKYLDEKYIIFFIKRKKGRYFMDNIYNYINEIDIIIKEYKIYRNNNFINLLLKDLLKFEFRIKKYFLKRRKLLLSIKHNKNKYHFKSGTYYKIIDMCNIIFFDIMNYYNEKKNIS